MVDISSAAKRHTVKRLREVRRWNSRLPGICPSIQKQDENQDYSTYVRQYNQKQFNVYFNNISRSDKVSKINSNKKTQRSLKEEGRKSTEDVYMCHTIGTRRNSRLLNTGTRWSSRLLRLSPTKQTLDETQDYRVNVPQYSQKRLNIGFSNFHRSSDLGNQKQTSSAGRVKDVPTHQTSITAEQVSKEDSNKKIERRLKEDGWKSTGMRAKLPRLVEPHRQAQEKPN